MTGFGDHATGGQGGTVYTVTRYDDPLDAARFSARDWIPGTLRHALNQPGPKIIRFSRDDVVELTAHIPLSYLENTTIEGPATILGAIEVTALSSTGGNNIVRNLRLRGWAGEGFKPWKGFPVYAGRVLDFVRHGQLSDGTLAPVLLENVSIAGAADQAGSFYYHRGPITLRRCLFTEGWRQDKLGLNKSSLDNTPRQSKWHGEGGHAYGPIIGPTTGVTVEGCGFFGLLKRCPWMNGAVAANLPQFGDVRNNVIFGWQSHPGSTQTQNGCYLHGNVWKRGRLGGKTWSTINCGYGGKVNDAGDNLFLEFNGGIITSDIKSKMSYAYPSDYVPEFNPPKSTESIDTTLDLMGCPGKDKIDLRAIAAYHSGEVNLAPPEEWNDRPLREYFRAHLNYYVEPEQPPAEQPPTEQPPTEQPPSETVSKEEALAAWKQLGTYLLQGE